MKFDLSAVFVAAGLGLATYTLLRFRRASSGIRFKDIRFDKGRNEIQLVVENTSSKRVFVRPSLRLVKITPAEEWKARTESVNSSVPMMTASAGSVIKGYDLIGEYADSVGIAPKDSAVITYPLMREFGLKAYDSIKVDSPVGEDPRRMGECVSRTLRMNMSDLLSDEYGEELLKLFNDRLVPESPQARDGFVEQGEESVAAAQFDGALPQSPPPMSFSKSDFPVQSMCYCCGSEKWLGWVVGGNHVCDGCRDMLLTQSQPLKKRPLGAEFDDDCEPGAGVELVESAHIDLKPRHRRILDVLVAESTLSAKELSSKLERDQKSVATDLRYLLKNNLVDRVKIRGEFKYFSVKGEQVILYDSDGEAVEQLNWT
jgi:predicted transcriptional regulator